MHSPSLRIPLRASVLWLAALRHRLGAWRSALQPARMRWAQARSLRRAERELAAMSLQALRDIGAPEALLSRRQLDDDRRQQLRRDGLHLPG